MAKPLARVARRPPPGARTRPTLRSRPGPGRRGIGGPAWALLAIALGAGQASADCPPGNLLPAAASRAFGSGDSRSVHDGRRVAEGVSAEAGDAVTSREPTPLVAFDLGAPRTLQAFVLQAGQNDYYSVEASLDGERWFGFWRSSPVDRGPGLRTRSALLPRPGEARYLRVRGQGGDRRYAVAELEAYCTPPTPWPPPIDAPSMGSGWIGANTLGGIKAALALAGLLLFALYRPRNRETTRRWVLPVLGLVSAAGWWNWGAFNDGRYLHDWEQIHHYLGAKYFAELRYTGLYECLAVADLEDGLEPIVAERKLRDLESNRIESAAALIASPGRCRRRFDDARWEAFRNDAAWLRGQVAPSYWARAQLDHGYNATPLSATVSGLLAQVASPAGPATIGGLALLDPLLLVVMWVAVQRTFGWRAAAAGMVWWGTNQAADFSWTGGAFLRQDWLVLSVLGLCAARSGRLGRAGFALTAATLLRVFPGFLVAALVVRAAGRMVRERTLGLEPAERRFAIGCVAALVFLGALSVGAGGARAWGEFATNARVHLTSHGSNTIGLASALAYDHATRLEVTADRELDDPFSEWSAARDRARERRRPLSLVALAGFLALLLWAGRRQPAWVVLVLGIGLVPFATVQSSYYYALLLGYGLLAETRRDGIAAMLCGLALVSQACAVAWPSAAQMDQRFAAFSVAVVAFVIAATWCVGRERVESR